MCWLGFYFWIVLLEFNCWPFIGTPFIAPSSNSSLYGHGGMQYFNSVVTRKCLHGLDGIHVSILQVREVNLRFQVPVLPGHYLQFSLEFLQWLSSTATWGNHRNKSYKTREAFGEAFRGKLWQQICILEGWFSREKTKQKKLVEAWHIT